MPLVILPLKLLQRSKLLRENKESRKSRECRESRTNRRRMDNYSLGIIGCD
jgi:hypothetical protein